MGKKERCRDREGGRDRYRGKEKETEGGDVEKNIK